MFNRLKDLQVNYTLILLVAFMVKMLAVNASIADAVIVAALGAVYGYTQYLKRFQPYKLDDAVMKDLAEVKNALSKINFIRSKEEQKKDRYF